MKHDNNTNEICDFDLSKIAASISGFQGAIQVLSLPDSQIWKYNADSVLPSPASAIKLHIALALEKAVSNNSISLDTSITIPESFTHPGETYSAGSSISVGQALDAMLSKSSNVTTNLIVDKLGGKPKTTNLFKSFGGFTNTNFTNYLSYTGDDDSPQNTSTTSEVTQAMYKLFTSNSSVAKRAINAMKSNEDNFNLSSVLNKDAGNERVLGNCGLFNVNGKNFIITVFYYGSGSGIKDLATGKYASPNDHYLTDVTNKILEKFKNPKCKDFKGSTFTPLVQP